MAVIVRETLPIVDAIAEKMERERLSARHVARALEVSPQTVTNWLKAFHPPALDADTQAAFARFLGVSPRRVVELFQLDLSDAPLGSGESRG